MKLSRKFLNDYLNLDVSSLDIASNMTKVGNEYDSCEKLVNASKLVIGQIKKCYDHPDSDHLHVCEVDVGHEILNIVCGAPNVRDGLKVIVALDGASLPGGVIKKTVIRGVESNGMICSIAELGFDNKFLKKEDKEGIHELDADAKIGEDALIYLEFDDEVIDFDLTANRGDLLSVLGMSYEIGAIYKKQVKLPDTSFEEENENINDSFKLEVNTDNCYTFLAKKVVDVTIKESPTFIKNRLIASGIRPINNVVDISNYVMLETGQPLHFYDASLLGDKIVVRMAYEDEKLTTLDGQERVLSEDDIVITDGKKAIGLAGVMGGLDTEINENTKNILIEAAVFDPVKIRFTSKKILRSEASMRYEKGLDTNNSMLAVERCCHLLSKYANAKIVSGICMHENKVSKDKKIKITLNDIKKLLGLEIALNDVLDVFDRLGFTTSNKDEEMEVIVPSRRIDISIKEDLIEEVGRIYGVDNIEGKMPLTNIKMGSYDKFVREVKNKMVTLGFNETLTYTLINELDINKYTNDKFEMVKVLDPMTNERACLRYSLLPSLLNVYNYNKARNIKDLSLFEIGKRFYKKEDKFYEENLLSFITTGKYYYDIYGNKEVDFYVLKGMIEEILEYLGFNGRYSFEVENIPKELHPKQSCSIFIDKKQIGVMGRVHPSIYKENIYVAELNIDSLKEIKVSKMKYKQISKFPSISKDLAFVVSKDVFASDIIKAIKKIGGKLLKEVTIFDIYEGKNIKDNMRSIAFDLVFESLDRTLTEEEVTVLFNQIIEEVKNKFNAELRDN